MTSVLNHLWQSTLFAVMAGLLTLPLRRNSARARYWLWFAASVKFLIPFSLLVQAGSLVEWRNAPVMAQQTPSVILEQVFVAPEVVLVTPRVAQRAPNHLPEFLCAVWLSGVLLVFFSWWRQWRRIHIAVRNATPFDAPLPIRTMLSRESLEPGVFGVLRPILLLPEGIEKRLMADQLDSIVAHALSRALPR